MLLKTDGLTHVHLELYRWMIYVLKELKRITGGVCFLYNHKLGELENEVASQSAHHVYCARLKASGCHYTQTSDTGLFETT